MALIKTTVDKNSREYITKYPVSSSIGAIGYGTVQGINMIVDFLDLGRDVLKLSRLSIKGSIIEADIEAKVSELNGLDRLAEIEAQLAYKKAELAKA